MVVPEIEVIKENPAETVFIGKKEITEDRGVSGECGERQKTKNKIFAIQSPENRRQKCQSLKN